MAGASDKSVVGYVGGMVYTAVLTALLILALSSAYYIRMYAIDEYGPIIHEFDPWFNFRATQYYADNGWEKFFTWFDYMSWYPLGRPVGSTIYPGMQVTSVWLWQSMNFLAENFGLESLAWSLNDVCCYVPCWFGVLASFFLGLIAYESSSRRRYSSMVFATAIMAVVPAHIMRSVGGGYDNESVAMTAMTGTFYFWVRSLRNDGSWKFGVISGFFYFYMAAVWGGFIFVTNMIALHAFVLVMSGFYTQNLWKAYSLMYVIGLFFMIRIPVVGYGPVKSMEQLSGLGVFLFLQLVEFCERLRKKGNDDKGCTKKAVDIYVKVFTGAAIVAFFVASILFSMGYFGPLSSRIRGLFVTHTRTGNPLVDSVSEHQPASADSYYQYLQNSLYLAPFGLLYCLAYRSEGSLFLLSYFTVAYIFSSKMARLIILMGPIVSALAGQAIGWLVDWMIDQITNPIKTTLGEADKDSEDEKKNKSEESSSKKVEKAAKSKSGKKQKNVSPYESMRESFLELYNKHPLSKMVRFCLAFMLIPLLWVNWTGFYAYSHALAVRMSHPTIVFKAQLRNGQEIVVEDYVDAYKWLKSDTPEDARIMAWWDYGYQITGIGNRTTLADGNTWNHEHIAFLARCLTGEEKEAHQLVRHVADYVLVWAGGGGDDLAKSPHLARIGNSVYDDICPNDPTCRDFGRDSSGRPTPFMARSLLYKLHSNGKPGVTVDNNRFEEVWQSKYGKVRIYKVKHVSKDSKKWAADPSNRKCDAPGSWYCVGQYPPAIEKIFAKKGIVKRDFSQLEDFNTKTDEKARKYQEEYHKRMSGKSGRSAPSTDGKKKKKKKVAAPAGDDAPSEEAIRKMQEEMKRAQEEASKAEEPKKKKKKKKNKKKKKKSKEEL